MNQNLISIDDDSLDQVSGGAWNITISIPTPKELIKFGLNAAGELAHVGGQIVGGGLQAVGGAISGVGSAISGGR